MKCVKCGAEIRKNHKFCENCGYPNEAYEAEVKSTEKDDDPDDFFEDVREKNRMPAFPVFRIILFPAAIPVLTAYSVTSAKMMLTAVSVKRRMFLSADSDILFLFCFRFLYLCSGL